MNKKNIVILVILLLVVLALAYLYVNNKAAGVDDNNDLSVTDSSNEGYEAVETTDEIIGEIDNSLNYFE